MPFPEPGGPINEMLVVIEIFELGFIVMVDSPRRANDLV